MAAGAIGMDHNDMAFMFYVTMSIWAFFEGSQKYEIRSTNDEIRSRKYEIRSTNDEIRSTILNSPFIIDHSPLLIGLFAGCAVLCKWLAGLVVFVGWAVWLAVRRERKWVFYKDFLVAVLVAITTFLPWQVYIHFMFSAQSTYERNYNTKHIWEAVENHSGKWYYYFQQLNFQYGYGVWMLIAFGMMLYFSSISSNKSLKWAFLSIIMAVFVFFSLIAQTKMPSYTYFISPLLFVMIALFIKYFTIQFNSIQFNSIQFNSIQFNSIQFNSIQFN
jgi:hypothetical protein